MASIILSCNSERLEFEYGNLDEVVVFKNIEEDIHGRDVLEFECPVCGEIHKSLVFGR